MAGKKMNRKRGEVESAGIQAFMEKSKYDGGYRIDNTYAKVLSFTSNEVFLWNGEGEKLDLVGIYSYELAMEKNEAGELVKAEVHIGKKVPASVQKH
jgi:hypothetical protein